jgi:hypothetical protein
MANGLLKRLCRDMAKGLLKRLCRDTAKAYNAYFNPPIPEEIVTQFKLST